MPRKKESPNKLIDKRYRDTYDFPIVWKEKDNPSPIHILQKWVKQINSFHVFIYQFDHAPNGNAYKHAPQCIKEHTFINPNKVYFTFRNANSFHSASANLQEFVDYVIGYYGNKLNEANDTKHTYITSEIKRFVSAINRLRPQEENVEYKFFLVKDSGALTQLKSSQLTNKAYNSVNDEKKAWFLASLSFWENLQDIQNQIEHIFLSNTGFELKKGQHKEYLLWLEEGLNYLKWSNPRYSLSDESKITLLNRLIRGKKQKT